MARALRHAGARAVNITPLMALLSSGPSPVEVKIGGDKALWRPGATRASTCLSAATDSIPPPWKGEAGSLAALRLSEPGGGQRPQRRDKTPTGALSRLRTMRRRIGW